MMQKKLRHQAEKELHKRLHQQGILNNKMSVEHMHELQVHQIELEMQNAALQQTRDDLENIQRQYASLFFDAPIAYMTCDEDGCVLQANHALVDLLGFTNKEDLQGISFASFASPKYQNSFYLHCREAFKSNRPCSCEIGITTHSGVQLYTIIESIVVMSSANMPKYIRTAVIDISKQKRTEEKLVVATKKAEAASRAKSDFLAVMSHELRTPLHGIIGLQNILAQEVDYLHADHRHHLEMAQHSSHMLQALIENILDLSKLEAGQVNITKRVFSLAIFLQDMKKIFDHQATERDISLQFSYQNLPKEVEADEALLRQIVLNLLGNAMKFTDKGYVRVQSSYENSILTIRVKDSGIGIAASQVAVLFKPFIQLSQDPSRTGTGLGTTIAMRLANAMSGSITVSSELGKGSVFTLKLPVEEVKRKASHQQVASSITPQTTSVFDTNFAKPTCDIRILLAEDDEISRLIASRSLKRVNLNVDIVCHGLDAWKKIQSNNYDLLLTDIRMPGIDGIELTRRIRESEQQKEHHTCIIGLSAHALEDVERNCLKIGMDAVFSKPINTDALLKKLSITPR